MHLPIHCRHVTAGPALPMGTPEPLRPGLSSPTRQGAKVVRGAGTALQ